MLHLPPQILQKHGARVLSVVVLHAAWCLEWGESFPFTQTLAFLLKHPHKKDAPAAPGQRGPILVQSGPKGLPGRDRIDAGAQ